MNQEMKVKRLKHARILLQICTMFIGVGALFGSSLMLIDPSGDLLQMKEMLPYFQVLPLSEYLFQNFVFSGICLLIVNGITNLVAFFFLCKKKKTGYVLGTIFGFTLMAWIMIQFVIFPANFLSIIYFIFGVIQAIIGICSLIFYNQTLFTFDEKEYTVNENSSELVLYFSRMGYSKKIAYQLADKSKGQIEEIKVKEKTEGTAGFWWCGRYGMKGLLMETEPLMHSLSDFSKITIVSPIWVFDLCSPLKGFLKQHEKELVSKEIVFVFNHFNKHLPKRAIQSVEKRIQPSLILDYYTHLGTIKQNNLK